MVNAIGPVNPEIRLAQLLGEDYIAQTPAVAPASTPAAGSVGNTAFTGNPFEDILSKAIESLNGVSRSEMYANELAEKYIRGEAELHEVMVAQAKMNVLVQLAVTTVNAAVTTFKEITQIQI